MGERRPAMSATQHLASPPAHPSASPASRSFEMRELRYFHSLARAGNFGRAARELSVSQPTLTKQVHKLEEKLGTPLFIRHGRGVTLTAAGMCLLDRLDIVMNLLNAPLQEAAAPRETTGTVSLALSAECAPLLVPMLMARCHDRWPRLELSIREADSASLEEWVLSGRVDVAVLQDPAILTGLAIEPVLTERLGLVVSPRSPLGASDAPVRARDLVGLPMILPSPRHWIRRRVENAWFRRGIALDLLRQVESITVTKEMLRNDLGCSILPHAVARDEIARGCLVFRPIEQMPLAAVHAIARRKEASGVPVIHAFARTLRDVMTELVSQGIWTGATLAEDVLGDMPDADAVPETEVAVP